MEARNNNYRTNEYIGGSTVRKLQDYIGGSAVLKRDYTPVKTTSGALPDIEYEPVRKQSTAPDRRKEAERRITEREARRRAEAEEERRRSEAEAQRNPGKKLSPNVATDIGLGRMIMLVAAIAVTLYVCFGYLKVQADIVVANKAIKNLETRLSDMKTRNESAYNAVIQAVDFEEVYQVAVGELGMVFPNKNTVYSYTPQKAGYVRQYADIPEVDRLAALKALLPLD